MKAHLVGGGLASLSAAAYLIRDAGFEGPDIHIYEAQSRLGGSLSVSGNPEQGYVYPGGRVFECHYRNALDLFSFIPSRTDPTVSIQEDVLDFNTHYGWDNRARLVDGQGHIVPQGPMALGWRGRMELLRLLLTPESRLEGKRIGECISPGFMESEFWLIWSSIMAFRPAHSVIEMRRYLLRFMHLLPELWSMRFILRTRINQQQAIVEPLERWLDDRGVQIHASTRVEDLALAESEGQGLKVTALQVADRQGTGTVAVSDDDLVFVTNGSHVAGLTTGDMDSPPVRRDASLPAAWALWQHLAEKRSGLGNPALFTGHLEDSTWVSFTVTDRGTKFATLMEEFTGRKAGRNGLVTFRDSNWLLTITRFHQPNAIDQPDDVFLWWGYGIYPERHGNFVDKPMTECTGREVLQEVLHHLKFGENADAIIETSNCIPCLMPYAGSVMLCRRSTDRAPVVPNGTVNLAFVGQFTEQPDDVAFTMEYSVRSARTAVRSLTGKGPGALPVYRPYLDPAVLWRNLRALQR